MGRDMIVDGEAMAAVESGDISEILGGAEIISMQDEPQRAAWNNYRAAFRANEAEPKLKNAIALVRAWNAFAFAMQIEQFVIAEVRR